MRKLLFFVLMISCASIGKAATVQDLDNEIGVLESTVTELSTDLATSFARLNLNQGPVLVGGVMTASPGGTIDWPLTLVPSTFSVTGLQADIVIPSSFTVVSVTEGPAATAAGKTVSSNVVNGMERILVFGLNQTPIGLGVVATVQFRVDSATPSRICPISFVDPVASDASGNTILFSAESGSVEVK
jgi:hypothetical protein